MFEKLLNMRTVMILYIALAFLSVNYVNTSDDPEQYTTLDTLNGQLQTTNLKLTSNFFHYITWGIVTLTLLSLTFHFSDENSGKGLNIIVLLVVLISMLFLIRYLYLTFSRTQFIFRK